jgi:AbrB family looped-hinge helix DNA binding protein
VAAGAEPCVRRSIPSVSYTHGMNTARRVGTKGQVVIPKPVRDLLGIHPGMEVTFAVDRGEVILRPSPHSRDMGGAFRGSALMADLLEERRLEQRREAKNVAR